MTAAPKREWSFSLREAFLVITAIGFAMGWAHERLTRPMGMTIRQAIDSMGDSERINIDCKNVESERLGIDGSKSTITERVIYWLVRERRELPD
jgi:hypothetical protein